MADDPTNLEEGAPTQGASDTESVVAEVESKLTEFEQELVDLHAQVHAENPDLTGVELWAKLMSAAISAYAGASNTPKGASADVSKRSRKGSSDPR